MILVSIVKRESFSTRPTLRWSGLIERTPTAVLMTVGHIAQSAIVKTAAGSDWRKITRPSGSHASGEIGRHRLRQRRPHRQHEAQAEQRQDDAPHDIVLMTSYGWRSP